MNNLVEVKIIRGFTEIKPLWKLVSSLGGMICGGYPRYMCSAAKHPAEATDVDVFTPSEEAFKKISEELKKLFPASHESEISESFFPRNNENCPAEWLSCPKIQLIKPRDEEKLKTTGTFEEVLDNFDYTVVRIGVKDDNTCLADENFENDEKHKYLKIVNIHCPVNSVFRLAKYVSKGYKAKPIEILKLFNDWEQRGQEYREKLVELLTKANEYNPDEEGSGLSQEERELLYKLMAVD